MRTAFCVVIGAGVLGGWALTWAWQKFDAWIDTELTAAEQDYWSQRIEAATPIFDAMVCEQMEAQFARDET